MDNLRCKELLVAQFEQVVEVYHLFYYGGKMKLFVISKEIFKIITVLICLYILIRKVDSRETERRVGRFCLNYVASIGMIYIVLDLLNLILGIMCFPIIFALNIEQNSIEAQGVVILIHIILLVVTILFFRKYHLRITRIFPLQAKIRIVVIFGIVEIVLYKFRRSEYNEEHITVYRLLIFLLAFAVVVFILWIYDKKQEQKKIQEITSYAHRTREVLPSVGRVLKRLDDLSEHMDQSAKIIEELQSICKTDMKDTKKETANIKTFETTGSIILDEQLERYLEEAAEQGFCLDIIVRAPVDEILEDRSIEIYSLVQVVGDLYRNANKVVRRRNGDGRILICFGYNPRGLYEISVYDNGEKFPNYILEHLGERGITTDGTGHGMADIFEVTRKNKISFILNQSMPESSVFTKGISLVFDKKSSFDIRVR